MRKTFTYLLQIILLTGTLLSTKEAGAVTYTFQTAGAWSTAANWSTGTVPPATVSAADQIVIAANCTFTLTADQTMNGSFTINTGTTLTLVKTAVPLIVFRMAGTSTIQTGAAFTTATFSNIFQTGTLTNNGTINLNRTFQQQGTLYNYGTVNLLSSTFALLNCNASANVIHNYGLITNAGGGSITTGGNFTNYSGGTLTNAAGQTINSAGAAVFTNNGTINNSGTMTLYTLKGTGTLVQNGTFSMNQIAPGNSPGTLNVTGNVSLGSGMLTCEINGTDQNTTYDLLNMTGTLTLNASSKLSLVFGYTPTPGDFYDIVTAGVVSGMFTVSNISKSGGTVNVIDVTYPNSNTVRVTVVSLLPVELVSFTAKETENEVCLDWQTAIEQNNAGFEVQRSADARNWQALTFVAGAGTTQQEHKYTYTDAKPLNGRNYYRLKQSDHDGGYEFSPVVSLSVAGKGGQNGLFYPNPSRSGLVSLEYSAFKEADLAISVFDATGRLVLRQTQALEEDRNLLQFDFSQLTAGTYCVHLNDGTSQIARNVTIE